MQPADFYLIRGLAREGAHWGEFSTSLQSLDCVKSLSCLDLLGAGKYHKLTSPMSIKENAEFLLSQISEKNETPKVIVSVSLGSMVAIEMAQLNQGLFSKIFVMNTSFFNLSPIYHRLQLNAWKRLFNILKAKDLLKREMEVLKMVSNKESQHKVVASKWVQIAKDRPMKLQNLVRQLVAAGTYRLAIDPPQTPLVVLRSMGDKMVHPSCSKKLADYWNLPLHTHESAGHDLCIDDPQWVLECIKEEWA